MTCKWINICPLRNLETKGKLDEKWKKQYCESDDNWKNCKRYELEEKGIYHLDNLLPDGSKVKIKGENNGI